MGDRGDGFSVEETVAKELRELGAATVGESGGRPLSPRIRPIWKGATLCAPAFTAKCVSGDNLAIHAAVAHAPTNQPQPRRALGW